jgi:hypothetical protein
MKKLVTLLLLSLCSVNAQAEESSDEWQFMLIFPMLWAPGIDGSIGSDSGKVDVSVPFSDIWDGLSFGLMGDFYARKDKWLLGVRTNYLYMNTDATLGGGIIVKPHDLETNVHLSVNDLIFGYDVYQKLELLTGIRHTFSQVDMKIRVQDGSGFIGTDADVLLAHEHLFDWVVGLKYTEQFGDNWGLALSVDTSIVGDNDTNRSFQLSGTYSFTEAHNLYFGYRYLNIVNQVQGIEIDLVEAGPQLGYAYRF